MNITLTHPSNASHEKVKSLYALTSLRFFAALLVVLFHYKGLFYTHSEPFGLFEIGWIGVTFFFILSGFILTYNYCHVNFSDRDNISKFLKARIARICPVALLSILVSAPFVFYKASDLDSTSILPLAWAAVPLAIVNLQAWVPGAACQPVLCPTWSISTEFFFYGIFPLAMLPILSRPQLWRWISIGGILASGMFVCLFWSHISPNWMQLSNDKQLSETAILVKHFIEFFPPLRLPEFLLGMCLFPLWRKFRHHLNVLLLILFAVGSLVLITHFREKLPEPFLHNGLTAITWCPLILACASLTRGPLVSPVAVYLGKISFALYLLHSPARWGLFAFDRFFLAGSLFATPWIGGVVAVAVAVGAASLAFHFVEEPMRKRITRARIHFRLRRWTDVPS